MRSNSVTAIPRKSRSLKMEKFDPFFEICPDLLCISGFDGFFKKVNDSFVQFLGFPEKEILSTPFYDFIHPDDIPNTNRRMLDLAAGGAKKYFETRFRNGAGEYRLIKWTASVNKDSTLIYCIGREIQSPVTYNDPLDTKDSIVSTILESITDGFILLDNNWAVTYLNKQAEYILGINRHEQLGKNIWVFYPEEVNKGFYTRYQEALTKQQTVHFEEYFERLNVWIEVTAYPSGNGLSVYFRDISKRKQKEVQLSEMNMNYRLLSKASSGAIWDYDIATGHCFWHDENFRNIFGHNIENELVSRSFWESLIHPDDRTAKLKLLSKQLNDGQEVARSEYRFKKADGTYAHVLERTFLVKNDDGNPVKLIGCTEDITAFKQAEQSVIQSEFDYRQLFQKHPLPQYICDAGTLKIVKVNEAALNLYGYSREEFLALDIRNFRHPDDQPQLEACVLQARQSEGRCTFLINHIKKNKERIIVEVATIKLMYHKASCILVTLSDQTERIRLENEFAEMQLSAQKNITKAALDGQEKQREEIGKELHDNINQVLATAKLILSCIDGLNAKQLELVQRGKEAIGYCIEEIRRLSHSFTPPSLGEISLEEAIHTLLDRIEFVKGEFVDISIHSINENLLPDGMKITIYRIIQEQLNNIMKYAEASRISIKITQNNFNLNLFIEDNGKGFDVKAKKKGIGLSNIINRASLYNGQVAIDAEEGKGCTVLVSFRL